MKHVISSNKDEVLTLSAIIKQNCLENEHSSLQHSGIKGDGKMLYPELIFTFSETANIKSTYYSSKHPPSSTDH